MHSATDHGYQMPAVCHACGSYEPRCGCRGREEHDDTPNVFEGSHAEFVASESHVSPGERAWLAWVRRVEAILTHDLDGNQERNGYSLDFANDAFHDGLTAEEYAAEVKADPTYKPKAA